MVNCSLFNPTPSLSAMIVNHFKMRGDVISYNLAGMGCSAGVIAIGLAQRLLKTEPGKYALVVSTENITQVCVKLWLRVPFTSHELSLAAPDSQSKDVFHPLPARSTHHANMGVAFSHA